MFSRHNQISVGVSSTKALLHKQWFNFGARGSDAPALAAASAEPTTQFSLPLDQLWALSLSKRFTPVNFKPTNL